MKDKHQLIGGLIRSWYGKHQRALPWRSTSNPYFIWLSEIILQQTRVDQGLPYYLKFIESFPTVKDLAESDEDHVLKLWQGLGYYSRARNLQFAAKQVMHEFNGVFPTTYNDLLKLKGIGPYSAAAISSIAFNEPQAVVDGNVVRVVARIFGIEDDVSQPATIRMVQAFASELLDARQPGMHNQAMMDFGAMQCTPKRPKCSACSVKQYCSAFADGKVDTIPRKKKKLKKRDRFLHFFLITDGHRIQIEKRGTKDIWAGLHQFPLIETGEPQQISLAQIEERFGTKVLRITQINAHPKHILSHQNLYSTFYHCEAATLTESNCMTVSLQALAEYAFPRLIDRYLESHAIL